MSDHSYKLMRLLRVPQSRDLITIGQAMKKLKESNSLEGFNMMFYLTYPEVSVDSLNLLADTFKKTLKLWTCLIYFIAFIYLWLFIAFKLIETTYGMLLVDYSKNLYKNWIKGWIYVNLLTHSLTSSFCIWAVYHPPHINHHCPGSYWTSDRTWARVTSCKMPFELCWPADWSLSVSPHFCCV